MSQFLYFIAGKKKLEEAGLAYAFDETPAYAESKGPGGREGVMLCNDPDAIRYSQDDQEWLQINADAWVGCEKENRPEPQDLKREKWLPGDNVKLLDGAWEVPRLQVFVDGNAGFSLALPGRAIWKEGAWQLGEVTDAYADADDLLRDLMARMQSAEQGDASGSMSFTDGLDYAARILKVNYRVSQPELSLLGSLPTDERLIDIVHIATDYKSAFEHFLGKAPARSASPQSSGDAG